MRSDEPVEQREIVVAKTIYMDARVRAGSMKATGYEQREIVEAKTTYMDARVRAGYMRVTVRSREK